MPDARPAGRDPLRPERRSPGGRHPVGGAARTGVLFAVVVALVAVSSVVGCGRGKREAPAPPTGVIVQRALQRASELRSVHFALKVDHAPTGAPGLTIRRAEGDLLVPDRLRARINGTFGATPIQSEIVIAGARSFLRDPLTKQWRPMAAGTNPAVFVNAVPSLLRRAADLRNAGSEKVGGADTYRLTGQVRSADVASLVGAKPGRRMVPFSVWVDKRRYSLRQIRLEGPVADTEPSNIVRTVELSGFDEPVTITTPTVSG